MALSFERNPFSKLLPQKRIGPVEEAHGYQDTRKRVCEATASVAGVAIAIAHDILSTGADLLQLAPVPALGTAGTVLLSIWEAVQLIEINRVACLRLTERCAETLLSIHEELRLVGSGGAGLELDDPMKKLICAFREVHVFLLKQKHRTFLQRYLKREEDQRDINECDASLNNSLSMFGLKVQIRALKFAQENEARRQEDSRLLLALIAKVQPSSTFACDPDASIENTTFNASSKLDSLNDPVKVRWLLSSYRRAQSIRDQNADFVDLRKLLNAALQEHDDVAMIEVLQIGRDEMPEAISTLQRVLQHDAEVVHQRTNSTSGSSITGTKRSRSPILRVDGASVSFNTQAREAPELDAFDRDFIATGIEALSRLTLSQGAQIRVPSWTITRHEVEIEKKIGIGFFSDVYKGQCRGHTVAIKVLANSTPRRLFIHEVNIWIQLQHPHVLRLLGASSTTSDPPWFLVSPYYLHGNLVHYLKGLEPDATADSLKMMLEIAEGMLYLHDKDILHGDLKASNILVDNELRCVVSDFGQSEMKSEVYRLSALPVSRGSLRWQSPELMLGTIVRLNPAVDIYAFGISCVEILTRGTLPWPLADDSAVRYLVCEQGRRPDIPSSHPPEHPISVIIQSAWHPEAGLRPPFQKIAQQFTALKIPPAANISVSLLNPVSPRFATALPLPTPTRGTGAASSTLFSQASPAAVDPDAYMRQLSSPPNKRQRRSSDSMQPPPTPPQQVMMRAEMPGQPHHIQHGQHGQQGMPEHGQLAMPGQPPHGMQWQPGHGMPGQSPHGMQPGQPQPGHPGQPQHPMAGQPPTHGMQGQPRPLHVMQTFSPAPFKLPHPQENDNPRSPAPPLAEPELPAIHFPPPLDPKLVNMLPLNMIPSTTYVASEMPVLADQVDQNMAARLTNTLRMDGFGFKDFREKLIAGQGLSNERALHWYRWVHEKVQKYANGTTRAPAECEGRLVEPRHVLAAMQVTEEWYVIVRETLSMMLAYGPGGQRGAVPRVVQAASNKNPFDARLGVVRWTNLLLVLREAHEEWSESQNIPRE